MLREMTASVIRGWASIGQHASAYLNVMAAWCSVSGCLLSPCRNAGMAREAGLRHRSAAMPIAALEHRAAIFAPNVNGDA